MVKSNLYEIEEVHDLKQLLDRSCEKFSNKIAFKYKKDYTAKVPEYINISYSQFKEDVYNLSTALINLNLQNKKVALISPNRYEWVVSYFASVVGNMIIVPLDKSLPDNEIKNLIQRSEAEAVIFDIKYENIFKEIQKDTNSNLKFQICMDYDNIKDNILSFKKLLVSGKQSIQEGNTKAFDTKIDPDALSIMIFTSGTTSISKAVMISQRNICTNVNGMSSMVRFSEKDVALSFLPLHHCFESTATLMVGLYSGATIAFCDGLRHITKNLEEYKVTAFCCVPLMLEAMYKKIMKGIKDAGKEKTVNTMIKVSNFLLKFGIDIRRKVFKSVLDKLGGHLRIMIFGAAPMDKNTIIGLSNFGIDMIQGYGLTETAPVIAAENDKFKRPGSCGVPLKDTEIKIIDADEHGIGEIITKGPHVMLGYYNNEEATNEVLKDGYFHTGDLGYIDKDGYLFVTGRKKNVIVLKNGKNIFPEELEILVNKIPFVVENIIYGKPDKDGDLTISVKIVYNPEIIKTLYPDKSEDEYMSIVKEQIKNINKTMPPYKHIRDIMITTEPLIKTTTEKIKRHEELKKILGQ